MFATLTHRRRFGGSVATRKGELSMTHELFTHDPAEFIPLPLPNSVDVSDVDAKYAAVFAEVIWGGLITAAQRRHLGTAAQVLGLGKKRVRTIEQALLAAHEARHRFAVVEQQIEEQERAETPVDRRSRKSIAPLVGHLAATSRDSYDELRNLELETRVEALESDHARLVRDAERLAQENDRLSSVAEALQGELAAARAQAASVPLGDRESVTSPRPRASRSRSDAGATADARHRSRRSIQAPPGSATPRAVAQLPSAAAAPLALTASPSIQRSLGPRNDPAELHRLMLRSPRDADLLRALFRALQRADDLDRRFCIAQALVYLGEANDQERATYTAHTSGNLARPTRAVEDSEWLDLLRHPEQDLIIGETLGEIAPAVLLGHVTAIRASLPPDVLNPRLEVDPRQSSEPAVRSLSWAAAILGIRLPSVFVCRELDRTVDIVLTPKPASRLGLRSLVGRSACELAFIAGRHLAWYRKELLLAQPERSARRLEDWIVAALLIGHGDLPLSPESKARVEPLAVTIRPLLNGPALARLELLFTRFVERGGRLNLTRWLESAELTAASAGLLLANDFSAAEAVLRLEGAEDVERTMGELVLFFTSSRCSTLRRRLGIAVHA